MVRISFFSQLSLFFHHFSLSSFLPSPLFICPSLVFASPSPLPSLLFSPSPFPLTVLWDTLTGKEHLEFYGRIKGLKGKKLQAAVKSCLEKVNLWDARNKMSKQYSGGMKRRLSVAISIIGSPRVIYLDEPSTGLDPKSRQDLWRVINEAKENAAVILTTHSMEEADAICDRLMIMAEGEIKCIGVSADLKNRFGQGFKLSIQVARGHDTAPAHEFVQKVVPGAEMLNTLAGTTNYQVHKGAVSLDKVFEVTSVSACCCCCYCVA